MRRTNRSRMTGGAWTPERTAGAPRPAPASSRSPWQDGASIGQVPRGPVPAGARSRLLGPAGFALAALLLPVLLFATPLPAREDSARLVFQKTAGAAGARVYVVRKGDSLNAILRKQLRVKRFPYGLIRRLNPSIRDLNRIYPGQRLLLPGEEKTPPVEPAPTAEQEGETASMPYRVQEGDSISRILLSELKLTPAEGVRAYRLIRQLNPGIVDLNKLRPGQLLHLPMTGAAPAPAETRPSGPPSVPAAPADRADQADQAAEAAASAERPPTQEELLAFLRPVLQKMRGTLTTRGNYFIPLQEAGQVTIDCFLIPVVELDDGSTILLDFGNRLRDNVKDLIRHAWTNYAFLTADQLRDGFAALGEIIGRSRDYALAKNDGPLPLTAQPEVTAFPDWVLTGRKGGAGGPDRQGLFMLDDSEEPLTAEARIFLAKHGLPPTEIRNGRPLAPGAASLGSPVMPDLTGLGGVALAEQLLRILGESPLRNEKIVIFDQARDGFNLSVTADLLLRKGDQRWIFQAKPLPGEFVRLLKTERTEVIPIGEGQGGRPLVEGVLQGLGIPVSFGYFTCRMPPEGRRPRLIAAFPALRTTAGGAPLYLIDFEMPPETLALLHSVLQGRIVRF